MSSRLHAQFTHGKTKAQERKPDAWHVLICRKTKLPRKGVDFWLRNSTTCQDMIRWWLPSPRGPKVLPRNTRLKHSRTHARWQAEVWHYESPRGTQGLNLTLLQFNGRSDWQEIQVIELLFLLLWNPASKDPSMMSQGQTWLRVMTPTRRWPWGYMVTWKNMIVIDGKCKDERYRGNSSLGERMKENMKWNASALIF